ncbi:uncharacterized protein [Watersipora subatra]|uniref:uncharacterized protein n=1 Tax=Watersipora subatra TaxID=2589382 RepID=UPI00355B1B79
MDIPVGILIGVDCATALAPRKVILGEEGETFAMRTVFGWTLCGEVKKLPTKHTVHSIQSTQSSTERCETIKGALQTDLTSLEILKKSYAKIENPLEDANCLTNTKMSQNDKQFLRILETGARKLENGSWCFPLPFKDETLLPNNRAQAEKRFEQLANELKGDATYKEEYDQFMREMIDNGHAELAPDEPVKGKTWYIPHFGVRHPRKDKLRVVFDASAKYKGQSLNDQLHTGPDMMNSLVGILLRFRTKRIAISCDIEKMFYNFFVTTDHRDFLRFLWKDANDSMANPQEYRMTRHLFGATSSPGVATFALRKIAKEYEEEMPIASHFILEDFYVDDGITSVDTVEEAAILIQNAIEICGKANLRLHKFLTNNREVLANIPASERVKEAQNLDLFRDKLPTERTLGLEWSVENDTIQFQNSMKSMPSTRRGILSVISQLYDPLGLLAPFIFKGRQISQKACGEKGEFGRRSFARTEIRLGKLEKRAKQT